MRAPLDATFEMAHFYARDGMENSMFAFLWSLAGVAVVDGRRIATNNKDNGFISVDVSGILVHAGESWYWLSRG